MEQVPGSFHGKICDVEHVAGSFRGRIRDVAGTLQVPGTLQGPGTKPKSLKLRGMGRSPLRNSGGSRARNIIIEMRF